MSRASKLIFNMLGHETLGSKELLKVAGIKVLMNIHEISFVLSVTKTFDSMKFSTMLNETIPKMLANAAQNKSTMPTSVSDPHIKNPAPRLQLPRQLSPRVLKPDTSSFVYSFCEVKGRSAHGV